MVLPLLHQKVGTLDTRTVCMDHHSDNDTTRTFSTSEGMVSNEQGTAEVRQDGRGRGT